MDEVGEDWLERERRMHLQERAATSLTFVFLLLLGIFWWWLQ